MWIREHNISHFLLITLLCVIVAGSVAPAVFAQQVKEAEALRWLDVDDEPLPFQDDAGICEALSSASLFGREQASRPGLGDFEMLVLEHDGARFYALFRSQGEAATFELAAYEIDRLLGLHHVPPAVERSFGGDTGAVQIWRQRAATELELVQADMLIPPDTRAFDQQRQAMYLLDNLIANPERSEQNLLVDPGWRIWLIDHAGAFQQTSDLLYPLELTKCERALWQRLQELDKDTLRERMEPRLDKKQISKLVSRHRKLVKHIQLMITTFGEGVVLYD